MFYVAIPLVSFAGGVLGVFAGAGISQVFGYEKDEIIPPALLTGAITAIAIGILLSLPIYSNKKAYDRAMTFLKDFKDREIIPNQALHQHLSVCSTEKQKSIIEKLNSAQLEGLKKAEKEQGRNQGLLPLIANCESQAKKVTISEEKVIEHEKKILTRLFEEIVNNKEYNDTFEECVIVYNDRNKVQDKLLKKERFMTVFRESEEGVKKNLTLFAWDNGFEKIKKQITKIITQQKINQIRKT